METLQSEIQVIEKLPRDVIVELLAERDGLFCQHPDCGSSLDFSLVDSPLEVTVDHWIPKSHGLANGWSWERIWDLDNLKLMHKKCNAKKGDLVPDADGTIPTRPESKFRNRRQKRVGRPEICTACNAGRDLMKDQICATCQSGPAPLRLPRYAKADLGKCDHATQWCGWCSIGIAPRASALEMLMIYGEGGE